MEKNTCTCTPGAPVCVACYIGRSSESNLVIKINRTENAHV